MSPGIGASVNTPRLFIERLVGKERTVASLLTGRRNVAIGNPSAIPTDNSTIVVYAESMRQQP